MSSNEVVLAAAGSGKTYSICKDAKQQISQSKKKVLILSFTNKGIVAIHEEYKKQNNGVIDRQIEIKSWYQFLLSELIKPYQRCIVGEPNLIDTYDFSKTYGYINYGAAGTKKRYISGGNKVISNYASEMCVQLFEKSDGKVIHRLKEIYSKIYIDEIQDLAGHDLGILLEFFKSDINIMLVGDNKQATYKTHNPRKDKKKSGENIYEFLEEYESAFNLNISFSEYSRRCNSIICYFANYVYPNEKSILSSMTEKTDHDGVFIIQESDIHIYMNQYKPQVLRYDKRTNTFGYPALNYGKCKGLTFTRIVIFPNTPFIKLIRNGEALKHPSKYYVASTRAKYSIALVLKKLVINKHFKKSKIRINNKVLEVSQFIFEK